MTGSPSATRRRFLRFTGVGTLGLAGCTVRSPTIAVNESTTMPDAHGPTRGENDVEIEVRTVEDDENVQYIEERDAVKYVAGWRHTNQTEMAEGDPPEREPIFETTPFERWGETQCLSTAAQTAAKHVNDELDTDEVSGGITSAVEGEDRTAIVSVETVLDRNGTVVHEPDVEFEALVAATPATVDATDALDEVEYELTVPVYARFSVLYQD
jgi:hypothetical protein